MPRTIYKRSASPAHSSSSQSDIEDDDVNKSTFFPSIEPVTISPAQWTSKVHLLNTSTPAFSSPASQFPPEILIHIFKHLHATRDIHSCLLVSRNWCECAVELLWHKPGIYKLPTFIKMMRILARADQTFTYARFIRRLNFLFLGKDLNNALFSRLSQCVRLERLTLVNCSSISDEALTYVFISCPNLLAIDLTGVTETTDNAIAALALTCKRLQGINLGGCKEITEIGIFALAANCPLLRRVKLSGIENITDDAVSALAKSCPLLLEIDLNGCKNITDLSVRDLWTYSLHVREMRLAHCTLLTDNAFPAIAKVGLHPPGVNPFPLSGTTERPTDALPPMLLSHPFDHLRMLDLTSCSKLTDEAIEGIITSSPKIRNLVLAKCSLITDIGVESICKLGKHLHYLHLGHTVSITDRSVRQLARSCTRLKYIDLANCSLLTDISVYELSALQKLRRIGLVRVNNLTDQSVYALTDRHATLERIHLSYCDRISVKAIHFLLQKLPKLTHLSLTGIAVFRKPELQQFCRQPPSEFNSSQRAAFCVFSNKGVGELRDYLRQMLRSIGEPDGENDDTDYEDYDYGGDRSPRSFAMDMEIGNEGDEEGDRSSTPRNQVTTPRPSRRANSSPGRQNNVTRQPTGYHGPSGQETVPMDVDPVMSHLQSMNGAVHVPSNRSSLSVAPAANLSSYVPSNGGTNGASMLFNGGRPRGFGQHPLIELPPPTSPTPSETASDKSTGTTHSHGAGFYKSYHEAVAAASSSRHHVLTPDLNYAEIGHGRGTDERAETISTISAAGGYDASASQVYGDQDYVLLDSSNLYSHPLERDGTATWGQSQRQRDRGPDESFVTTPTTREQELNQNALASSTTGIAEGRGRMGKRGWRNTLTAAEQYASSFLFGGRGGTLGVGGPSNGVPEG